MSNLTRAEMIEELTGHLNHWKRLLEEGICGKEQGERTIKSLEFAIDSLKVDEAYKLMYEKVDYVVVPEGATNGDMIKAMFPNIQWDNECDGIFNGYKTNDRMMAILGVDFNWWNSPYRKE